MEKIFELTKEQEEVLIEVGTVGAGYATTALSKMTNKEAEMKVTSSTVTSIEEIPKMIKTTENTHFFVYTPILGIISGSMMIIMDRTTGYLFIDMIERKPLGTTKELDRMGESALAETQNIIGNAYITAFNDFVGVTLIPAIPRVMFNGILDLVPSVLRESAIGWTVLTINTEFLVEKKKGMFTLVMSLDSITPMLKAIRERMGGRASKK